MFNYYVQQIVNGWLLTIDTPSEAPEKLYYSTELEVWETLAVIAAQHVELAKKPTNE